MPALIDLYTALKWLVNNVETILKFTQLVGIPVAIALYMVNKQKERRDKDYGTYDSLDDKYIDYLKLCLDYPNLDVADTPKPMMVALNAEDQQRERVIFSILISIMERAYLMYSDRSYRVRQEQWDGWDGYIEEWCSRPNFAAALPNLAPGFDERFVNYLRTKVLFQEED